MLVCIYELADYNKAQGDCASEILLKRTYMQHIPHKEDVIWIGGDRYEVVETVFHIDKYDCIEVFIRSV